LKSGIGLLKEAEEITKGLKTNVVTQLVTAEEKRNYRQDSGVTTNRIELILSLWEGRERGL
jgi:hypothetical protein